MTDFVLDASFALRWCFEDEATAQTDAVLTLLEDREVWAWVPAIWSYEILNGLGKGIARGRMDLGRGLSFWREIRELPMHFVDVAVDEELLHLALRHNLAIYDASYLSLAMALSHPLATNDLKLATAAESVGVGVVVI